MNANGNSVHMLQTMFVYLKLMWCYLCDIFGYHNWLQSDAAFFYPRLDQYSLSVGMFCSTCGLTRRPLGRLATASSLAGNAS